MGYGLDQTGLRKFGEEVQAQSNCLKRACVAHSLEMIHPQKPIRRQFIRQMGHLKVIATLIDSILGPLPSTEAKTAIG